MREKSEEGTKEHAHTCFHMLVCKCTCGYQVEACS